MSRAHTICRRIVTDVAAERLEDRRLLAVTFTQTNLISDAPGLAARTDANLVNPWGIALGTNNGLWIADNGSDKVVSVSGSGRAIPSASPQVVTIPAPDGTGTSAPTGIATNATAGFGIASGNRFGPSTELFATEDGTIAGFSRSVNRTRAVIAVDNSDSGAVYKGLALGFTDAGARLYATNFRAGTVDVFDSNFAPVQTSGGFKDANIPAGFAPFGISAINSHIYVTYAKQDAEKEDDVAGAGNGFIDIFDTDGKLLTRFASRGHLNAPWGMAWAPFEGFDNFNNALFVGNFGDGVINAFDFDTGAFLGTVRNRKNKTITIEGVWGLQFGLGVPAGADANTLFFTAGPGDEMHGLFGTLTVNPASLPPPEEPTMTDPNLQVSTVLSGLNQPTGIAFLEAGDFLALEKASGKVLHVVNGAVQSTVLTLPVNSASERGLLGIALQPKFDRTHGVYLYWTESKSATVSTDIADVPVLGNRVDRYVWNPTAQTLTFDRNIMRLRSFQEDPGQPLRGNHDGGKILFGPDGKLYVQIGDQGRRGQMQNLTDGHSAGQPDDQFGGPRPDRAHVTGVIFRVNADGTAPSDNPFFRLGAHMGGIAGSNVRKIFSYGHRNSFGLAFDPMTGSLWQSENGDDSFDEMNRITAGSNGGWVQIMGPAGRVGEFKEIETNFTPLQGNLPLSGGQPFAPFDPATFIPALQQVRWPPSRIADSSGDARDRLFVLPGSHYEEPEFSWKWAIAPAAIGFAGSGLGAAHANNLFVGAARTFLDEGFLPEFKFDKDRQHFAFSDEALTDQVDDNDYKFDEGESDVLLAGENFGIVTDIVTGPDGNLYVASISNGAVYRISQTTRGAAAVAGMTDTAQRSPFRASSNFTAMATMLFGDDGALDSGR